MLLDLIICKFEHLKSIWESRLSGLGFSKVVYNFLIRISLLNITVVEIDNGISIREHFPLYTIVENNFLLSVFINFLDFADKKKEVDDNDIHQIIENSKVYREIISA